MFLGAISGLMQSPVARADAITEADLLSHIEILASDEFGGRKPGTEGENKTVNYIATQWQAAGLRPAAGEAGWYAPVDLVDRTPLKQQLRIAGPLGRKLKIKADELILRGADAALRLDEVEIVHAGYGVRSDAQLEQEVSGKLALIYLRAPPLAKDFPSYRKRKASLISAGAMGVIAVIESEARFLRASRRFRTPGTTLNRPGEHAPLEGLMSVALANRMLNRAGRKPVDFLETARGENFTATSVGTLMDVDLQTRVRKYISHNVVGKIAGSQPGRGAVLFLGHWDHLGECRRNDAEDRICNGAVDNASGIAVMTEAAKHLVNARLDRDIYFLATTAEESGLLGARAFVEKPPFDLAGLVATFNIDSVALAADGGTIAVVGRGKTLLDGPLEQIAAAEGREIDTSDRANAFLRRQDGYAFLEREIPALMVTSAFADPAILESFLNDRYHDVGDEADAGLILGGAADDANFHVALGRYFGSTDRYPAKGPSE